MLSIAISHLALGALCLAGGLRWKHRRFLVLRNRVAALEARMDAYRLADSRTDLDEVGPVGTNPQKRDDLRAEYDEDLADIVLVASRMATDTGERHSLEEVMAKHGITQDESDADESCGRCGRSPAAGFATIGDTRYCHGDDALISFEGEDAARRAVAWLQGEDDEPTCYELAQSDAYQAAPWSRASHLQADPADDTGVGTVKFLSGEWAPAAPAPKQVGR